jgi:SpoVK/Ycf46/Vps4 family AAA+-type ATPase
VNRFKLWAEKHKASWTREGQKFGLKPPKGVLLVGVWGCGKSISVKGLGHAWNLPVVQLELGKLRQSGVGDSESNMYRALSMIESVAPCLVWVDEGEKSLSGSGSSNQSDAGTTSRMLGIFSTWLQETKSEVCLAMTVNSLKTLPVEFVRRMNERFFFDLPSEDERIDILKIHLTKQKQDPKAFKSLAKLAEDAKLMVGSEIEQAIETAMTESFHANKSGLDEEILSQELKKKPRIFKTLADELKEVLDWVGFDPDTGDGIRARFASDTKGEGFRAHQVNG